MRFRATGRNSQPVQSVLIVDVSWVSPFLVFSYGIRAGLVAPKLISLADMVSHNPDRAAEGETSSRKIRILPDYCRDCDLVTAKVKVNEDNGK